MGSDKTRFQMRIRVINLVVLVSHLSYVYVSAYGEDIDYDYQLPNITSPNYEYNYDVFKSYCSESTLTDTSTFLSFGSSDWLGLGDGTKSNWVDDRDEWILEADDIYKPYLFNGYFGGSYKRFMCISSNGPVYLESYVRNCGPSRGADFNPQHISPNVDRENEWTGVSAFWSDFLQASNTGQDGGNVYHRQVSVNDNDYRSILDLMKAANNMLTEEYLSNIHVITFHKMADINGKRGCNKGVSFQYIIAPLDRTHDNPIVHFAYGEFEWAVNAITAGWNAYFTRAQYGFHLTIDPKGVGDVSHLERKSFTCDGSDRGCWQVQCQQDTVMDNINDELLCEDYVEVHGEPDRIYGNLDFSLFLDEVCVVDQVAHRYHELDFDVDNFLIYAYQWADMTEAFLKEVNCRYIPLGQTDSDGNDILEPRLELVVSGSIGRWITSGLLINIGPAQAHIRSTLTNRLKVPVKAMEMWAQYTDKSYPELVDNGYNSMKDLLWDIMDFGELAFEIQCGWGRRYDPEIGCVDIDECDPIERPENPCKTQFLTECINLDPGYTCGCDAGFTSIPNYGDPEMDPDHPERGPFICEDQDECELDIHTCSELQVCENTYGGFTCRCGPEYTQLSDGNGNYICAEDVGGENLWFMDSIALVAHVLRNKYLWGLEETPRRRKRDLAQTTAESLLLYGCWGPTIANLENAYEGRPIDRVDFTCRKRISCGNCFTDFFKESGETCNPQTQMWYVIYYDDAPAEYMYECGGMEGSCERATCACNLEFGLQVAKLIASGKFDTTQVSIPADQCLEITERAENGYQCMDNELFYVMFR